MAENPLDFMKKIQSTLYFSLIPISKFFLLKSVRKMAENSSDFMEEIN